MPSLVYELNALLRSLELTTRDLLSSPTDLTPTLLLAILSALLPSLSASLDTFDDDVQAMKMFLGVLETDVLRNGDSGCEVSVCHVDPRRLARGGEEECEYVGSVLVWLGKQLGLGLKPTATAQEEAEEESMVEDILAGLDDPMDTDEDDSVEAAPVSARKISPKKVLCIHDLSFSSPPHQPLPMHGNKRRMTNTSTSHFTENESSFEFFTSSKRPKIKHDGWISLADERSELEQFDTKRYRSGREARGVTHRPTTPPSPSPISTRPTPMRPMRRRVSSGLYTGEDFDILRTPQHQPPRTSRIPTRPSIGADSITSQSTQSPSDFGFNQRRLFDHDISFHSEATSVRTHTLSHTLSDPVVPLDGTPRGSYARTLALLNRRATLLEEIARRERMMQYGHRGT